MSDKAPPYNLEAERSALGSMLLDNDCIDDIAAMLAPSDFFRGAHQEFYAAILAVQHQGGPADGVTVADHLIGLGRYGKIGGDDLLTEIVNAVPHAANARYYAGIVREKSVLRRLLGAGEELIRGCYAAEKPACDLLCDAEEAIFAIGEERGGEVEHADTLTAEAMARFAMRCDGHVSGLTTGLADLDALTGGMQPGELTILGARPSQGKSALAMDVACSVATAGHRALIFSIEMGRQSLMDRLLCNRARVDGYKFARPWGLRPDDRRRLNEAAGWIESAPLSFSFAPSTSTTLIGSVARRVKRQHGLALVVVDYLGLIDEPHGRGETRQDVVARISRRLKGLARSLAVPVLCLSQLNREVEKRSERRPTMADLRESGAIEQDADVVLLLHRPEYYDPNDRPGLAELIVAKNRNGATGDVRLMFERQFTRFRPFEEPRGMPISDDTSF